MRNEPIHTEQSDPTGGLSNSILLVLSLSGITVVFIALLIICIKSPAQSDDEEEEMINYDQALQEADVATLTRAQRRARAKLLMKKNRRLANNGPAPRPDPGGIGQQVMNNAQGGEERLVAGAPGALILNNTPERPKLTRKQRQKAAKELERAERKANEEQIRIQKRCQDEDRQKRATIQQNKKLQAAVDKKERLEREFRAWKYMFPESDLDTRVTVKEFVEELHVNPMISLEETAEEFSVSVLDLIRRLEEIEGDGRIGHGIFNIDEGEYVYVNKECMNRIVKYIHEEGKVSLDDLAKEMSRIVTEDCEYVDDNTDVDVDRDDHGHDKKNQ
jgi:hypothetical protein